ncbi:MAG TPA: hypothetical protein VFX96_13310 [Pyrinomonadaceae bacterium]|nr:hypothetical protein [Pyrinomonadaceae bacterium]
MRQKNAMYSAALLLLLCAPSLSLACQEEEKQRRPSRYLIPDGFVGWVKIYYKVKDAPPLPFEDGAYLFKIPASGVLKTSSSMEYGWASDEYFYYSDDARRPLKETGWGEGGMIWAGHNGSRETAQMGQSTDEIPEENKTYYSGFFVGTEAEYKDYGRWVDDQEPGPIDKEAIERKKKKDN